MKHRARPPRTVATNTIRQLSVRMLNDPGAHHWPLHSPREGSEYRGVTARADPAAGPACSADRDRTPPTVWARPAAICKPSPVAKVRHSDGCHDPLSTMGQKAQARARRALDPPGHSPSSPRREACGFIDHACVLLEHRRRPSTAATPPLFEKDLRESMSVTSLRSIRASRIRIRQSLRPRSNVSCPARPRSDPR